MNAPQIDVIGLKQRTDLRAVASNYTRLDKPIEGHRELHGPCPFCGGRDRFYVSPGVAGCRVCGFGGDVIAFIQKAEGLDFMGAVEFLDKGAISQRAPVQPSGTEQQAITDDDKRRLFQAQAPALMDAMHRRLMHEDTPGAEYLMGRGLLLDTWAAYGLGYTDDASGRGPAVAMPWQRGGKLIGIRYRLLHPQGTQKIVSETGSQFGGQLYGMQALTYWPRVTETLDMATMRTMVIIEGEINGMSIWQTAHGSNVDVLSLGSESAKMTPAALDYARRFRACLVWMDKAERAQALAKEVGGAAFWSEVDGKKQDANDWLRSGKLGRLLVRLITQATPKDKRAGLAFDFADGGLATGRQEG